MVRLQFGGEDGKMVVLVRLLNLVTRILSFAEIETNNYQCAPTLNDTTGHESQKYTSNIPIIFWKS